MYQICKYAHISCLIELDGFRMNCKQTADKLMEMSASNKMDISTKFKFCKDFAKFQLFLLENWHYF